jgi:predicted Zn-dependent protease
MGMRFLTLMLAGASLWAQESREKEAALGAQLAKEVESHTTAVDNAFVREAVDRLGQRLAVFFSPVTFKFSVITDRPVGRTFEPIALPGGYIFVSTELILAARDEAEFAGMLAHAMARSAAPPAGPRVFTNGEIPLVWVGWAGNGDNEVAVPLSLVKVRRAAELDADRKAVQAMAAAGFDPDALVRYVERTQTVGSVFSSLPPRADRVAALRQAIRKFPPGTYSMSEEFSRIQDAVRMPPTPVAHTPSLYRADERH